MNPLDALTQSGGNTALLDPPDGNAQQGQEHTPDTPMQGKPDDNSSGLNKEDQSRLMQLVRRYCEQWAPVRRQLLERCLENFEFFKGNHFTSFNPDAFEFFDGISALNKSHAEDSDDRDLYKFCNNLYQMLATAFVAALSPQLPKSVYIPQNAEYLQDVTTAKTAQILIDIVERKNREKALLKQQLLYLFMCGCYFRHTRYIVSADRAGTHKEPVYGYQEAELIPDRHVCDQCGQVTPANSVGMLMGPQCQHCGAQLDQSGFFPAETGTALTQVGTKEQPDGMVAWSTYSPLEVDADPRAKELRQTPLLKLELEIHVAELRASYPEIYDQIAAGTSTGTSDNGSLDRTFRQQVYAQADGGTRIVGDDSPTLTRAWIQPWAFDLEADRQFGERMRKLFPSGCLIVYTGETFLEAREERLTDKWTHATCHEGFGLFSPCPGDVVIPFNKRFNDISNIIHEFMDRSASGITLGNTDLIDPKALNGKPLLPGIINPIKLKGVAATGSKTLAEALFQFKFELAAEAYSYGDKLLYLGQMMSGVPPQIYGGAGDPNVQTKGGQEQQLNTSMGKLNIYWENLREEHAAADELAVKCAKDNLTDDMRDVIAEQGSEFRNQYVRIDDLQGDIHAYPDTDQGFPMTAGELRERWQQLFEMASKDPEGPIAQLFDDSTNQEQAAKSMGMPGLVIPAKAMSSKVAQNIAQLLKAEPVVDPQTGQKTPTILPDKSIDDFEVIRRDVRKYCQENCDLARTNPEGFDNVLAYLQVAVQMATAEATDTAQRALQVQQAGQPQPQQPPPPNRDKMAETVDVIDNLRTLRKLPPLGKAQSIAGQVAAATEEIKVLTSQPN